MTPNAFRGFSRFSPPPEEHTVKASALARDDAELPSYAQCVIRRSARTAVMAPDILPAFAICRSRQKLRIVIYAQFFHDIYRRAASRYRLILLIPASNAFMAGEFTLLMALITEAAKAIAPSGRRRFYPPDAARK